eukprot:127158_1
MDIDIDTNKKRKLQLEQEDHREYSHPQKKKHKVDTSIVSVHNEADKLLANLSKLLESANPDFNKRRTEDAEENRDSETDAGEYHFQNWGDYDNDLCSAIIFFNHKQSILETKCKYNNSLKAKGTISKLILKEEALFQLITDFVCDDTHFSDQQFVEILRKSVSEDATKWYKCAGDTFSVAKEYEDSIECLVNEVCHEYEEHMFYSSPKALAKSDDFKGSYVKFSNEMIQ